MRWMMVIVALLATSVVSAEKPSAQEPMTRGEAYELLMKESIELCRERNPSQLDQHQLCIKLTLHADVHEAAGWTQHEFPIGFAKIPAEQLGPMLTACIERAMDGELTYAPLLNACMRSRVEQSIVEKRRQERLRRERGG